MGCWIRAAWAGCGRRRENSGRRRAQGPFSDRLKKSTSIQALTAGLLAVAVAAAAQELAEHPDAAVPRAVEAGSEAGSETGSEAVPETPVLVRESERLARQRVDALGAEGADWIASVARRLTGEAPANGGGVSATLQSDWILRRRDRPTLYLTLHLNRETSHVELRGGGIRFGERGFGLYLERGETDRELRMGLDYRLVF